MNSTKLTKLFKSLVNLNRLNRTAIKFETNENNLNVFEVVENELKIKQTSSFLLKTIQAKKNELIKGKKIAHRALLGKNLVEQILLNKTTATQFFILYLNQALTELTFALGNGVLNNKNNKLKVVFVDRPELSCIEMQTIIVGSNE